MVCGGQVPLRHERGGSLQPISAELTHLPSGGKRVITVGKNPLMSPISSESYGSVQMKAYEFQEAFFYVGVVISGFCFLTFL